MSAVAGPLYGIVARVRGYRSRGAGSIPGVKKFSVELSTQLREYN
jgi:hypothetical protein